MDEKEFENIARNLKTFTPQMTQNPYHGIATFFGVPFQPGPENIDIAIAGVPFDLGVTNRSGTRMGPRELRNQSLLVGAYNHHSQMTPCALHRIADLGDVPFRGVYNLEEALQDIEAFFRKIASAGVVPITAGGDHSITYPILKGLAPKKPVGLIHFDSHCDTAPSIHGSAVAHGSPMKNAVEAGLVDPEHAIQIGIRGSSEILWQFSYENKMRVMHIEEFAELGWKKVVKEIRDLMGSRPVYISFDIDCLDPAFAPGTGTPVAGGMSTLEALQTLRGLKGLNVIGGDVVEVSPPYDHAGITALAGATIMFEILCLAAEARAGTCR
ncbi:MAG: agmatinase [Methanomicrobiales archaeon]|nr:agmatinase [Methanomicrobiales archaeon]